MNTGQRKLEHDTFMAWKYFGVARIQKKVRKKEKEKDQIEQEIIYGYIWEDYFICQNPLIELYTKGNRKGFKQESGRINKIKKEITK